MKCGNVMTLSRNWLWINKDPLIGIDREKMIRLIVFTKLKLIKKLKYPSIRKMLQRSLTLSKLLLLFRRDLMVPLLVASNSNCQQKFGLFDDSKFNLNTLVVASNLIICHGTTNPPSKSVMRIWIHGKHRFMSRSSPKTH
jgi:hypothetical protein